MKLHWYTEMLAERDGISTREIERAAALEELGLDPRFCQRCKCAMPKRRHQFYPSICLACDRKAWERKKHWRRTRGTYVDDGNGCVEKVPSWMVDWDGDRGHKRGPAY